MHHIRSQCRRRLSADSFRHTAPTAPARSVHRVIAGAVRHRQRCQSDCTLGQCRKEHPGAGNRGSCRTCASHASPAPIKDSTGCAHRSINAPPARSMRIRSPSSKTKKPPNGDFLFWWTRRGVACIGCADKGIHQRARWLMHMPPACAIMIRSPSHPHKTTKNRPLACFLFWQKTAILTKSR